MSPHIPTLPNGFSGSVLIRWVKSNFEPSSKMCVCIVSSEIVMVLQFLMTLQEITGSSTWEECKTLVEESYEFKYDIFSYVFFFHII